MVFALATLFDCDMPPYSVEAYEYYILARAALRFAPPMFDTTLMAVQSLVSLLISVSFASDTEPFIDIYGAIP